MPRRRIATRYATLVVGVLALALVGSGAIEAWVNHKERLTALERLQREQASNAAAAVSRFAAEILRSLHWASLSTGSEDLVQRRLDFIKLLRMEPAITTAHLIDRDGRELLRVSRVDTDRVDSGADMSHEASYAAARAGQPHFGEVEFVAQSEPYLTVAVPGAAGDDTVVVARVNLKFVQSVVSEIRIGRSGYAYVVDEKGRLVSHRDLTLVLQMADITGTPQVVRARERDGIEGFDSDGRDIRGEPVLSANAHIVPLGWTVFVEQPRAEALAPLAASIRRTAAILITALLFAAVAGVFAAYRLVAPIGELRRGAQQFGTGDLRHRIRVTTGDELEELAVQFNTMATRLLDTYESLERRVEERTRDLDERNAEVTEALEQQTAIAEVLRAIGSSPTEARPVFDAIVQNALRLCRADFACLMLDAEGWLSLAARTACASDFARLLDEGVRADRSTITGRAALERRPVQVLDIAFDTEVSALPAYQAERIRTVLAVPVLRGDRTLGVLTVWRRQVLAFSDKQVDLLRTFADQAVIAVESLRLVNAIQQSRLELERANQAKTRFLAAASHDLRQPMHALSLFVGQLRSSRNPADRAALAQRIEQAVGGLSNLLDQLLDLSRLEAGAVQAVEEDFSLAETVAAIEAQFAPLAHAKGLELRIRCPAIAVRSDPLLVQRVLLNLVANAIRYTERGGVLIGCRHRGTRVRVAVWDTGSGIPEDQRDHVFREFVQLGRPRPPHDLGDHGLGLGLAIVARTAELLGAPISLRSQVGRGSMFAFELPLGAEVPLPRPAAPAMDSMDGAFVIVVDDDEAAGAAMRGLLESWGSLTLVATSGEDALAQLTRHDRPPELVVCDYRLGKGMDGLQTIARLRAAVGQPLPAVLVTADPAAELVRSAQGRDVAVVRKPALPLTMRAVLTQVLGSRPREKAA